MINQLSCKRFQHPVPPSSDDEPVIQMQSFDFVLLGEKAKQRRELRRESPSRSASSAGVSKSSMVRFEAGDCEGINYQSIRKIMIEMSFSLYIDGISHENPAHLNVRDLIKTSRKAQGLTLRGLSSMSGVLFSTIFSIENCDTTSDFGYLNAIKVLTALGHNSCVIQTDDAPSEHEAVQIFNFRHRSGHPMYRSPYL